jgi:hypothetical protein
VLTSAKLGKLLPQSAAPPEWTSQKGGHCGGPSDVLSRRRVDRSKYVDPEMPEFPGAVFINHIGCRFLLLNPQTKPQLRLSSANACTCPHPSRFRVISLSATKTLC